MRTVYFVRHGEIDNPRKIFYGGNLDLPLSDQGRLQMEKIAEVLTPPAVIYTSHLGRSYESGLILARRFGIFDIRIDRRIGDNMIPQFVGMTREEKETLYPGRSEFDSTLPGHETLKEVLQRNRTAYEEILANHQNGTIIIVGHGDPLRVLLFSLQSPKLELPPIDELPAIEKGRAWRIVIDENNRYVEHQLVIPSEIRKERE